MLSDNLHILVEIACQPYRRTCSPAYFGGDLVSVVEYLIKTYRIKVLRLIMGGVLFLNQISRRE
jgi:hypothetical protein